MAYDELFNEPRLERLRRPYSLAVRRYLPRSNVLGISVGPRTRGDIIDWDNIVLRIRVKEKKDPDRLGDDVIPAMLDGVETDIVEGTGLAPADRGSRMPLCRTDPCDPLVPGVSIGVPGGSAGTLGMFVDHPSGGLCILTADHVIAPRGDENGLPVCQPDPKDYPGNGDNSIGRAYKRLPANGVALVRCDTERKIEHVPVGAEARLRGTRPPRIGDILEKSGRATGITRAKVSDVGAYRGCKPGFELVPVDDSTNEISKGGDSGSIWYDPETYEAIGVHCRGDGDDDFLREWARAAALYHLAPCLELTL